MKKLIPILFLLFSVNCIAQTQAEMNQDAYGLFQNADKELNKIYNQILTDYKKDTIFIENLKKAQRIWVQFRDAELNMKFPAYPGNHYGSMLPMCRAFYLKELTENRTETLRAWLGIQELDGCNGSARSE
jgi:uncharacterized protein YecT (DUF1311 family)